MQLRQALRVTDSGTLRRLEVLDGAPISDFAGERFCCVGSDLTDSEVDVLVRRLGLLVEELPSVADDGCILR